MARQLFVFFSAIAWIVVKCAAKTVTYDFNVTWVIVNPDGLADRKVIGVNNTWPLPVIEVDKGDRLVVNMYNGLGDRDASIHFHGMFQNGTNEMDGPSYVTQCPIPPGSSFTYNFTIEQNGTYWYVHPSTAANSSLSFSAIFPSSVTPSCSQKYRYHCHTDYCYPDGYRQALIVHDEDAYFTDLYDEEFTVTLSDWYHELVEDIGPDFLSLYNPTGAEPVPDSILFNDTMNTTIDVQPGTTYLMRIVNTSAFAAQYFYIQDHTFEIVEIDGVYTERAEASVLYVAVAQRYSILLTTKNSTDANYAIVTCADQVLFDTITPSLQLNNTNWLSYNADTAYNKPEITLDIINGLPASDAFTLVPYDRTPLLPDPDYQTNLEVVMQNLADGKGYAFFNNITSTKPKVPTLYTVLSSGDLASTAEIYGEYTNAFVLKHNDVVEVVINNADTGSHPFHLHGHNFQVIARYPAFGDQFYEYCDADSGVTYDTNNHTAFPEYPARRDVLVIPPQGYFVIRFVADNPGVWFFHCHIDWHLSQGLASVFIEASDLIQEKITVPANHYAACAAAGVATEDNAAGNTEDYTNLSGQNVQPAWIPYGSFTPKGIVAMTFSVVSAIVGIISLNIYGMSGSMYIKKKGSSI
ncbi:Iron transport multicopper oxidase FET3 protein [Rutstroemia sp. NJR-2017a BVV2]|nr:Iron transport multicopper oxidase FET3 protein [Rutstroemia sp. NJR-2017a BVV2]